MKTENELIAEFMGLTLKKEIDGIKYYNVPVGHIESYNASQGDFKYHKRWDWLMPVVEKIESIYKQGKLFQCPQYQRIRGVKITDVTITELHELIVDFIKWYNSQNS